MAADQRPDMPEFALAVTGSIVDSGTCLVAPGPDPEAAAGFAVELGTEIPQWSRQTGGSSMLGCGARAGKAEHPHGDSSGSYPLLDLADQQVVAVAEAAASCHQSFATEFDRGLDFLFERDQIGRIRDRLGEIESQRGRLCCRLCLRCPRPCFEIAHDRHPGHLREPARPIEGWIGTDHLRRRD